MNRSIYPVWQACLACVLLTACQTSRSGGSPEDTSGEGVEDAVLVDAQDAALETGPAASEEALEFTEGPLPDPSAEEVPEDAFRVSVQGDDGEWEVLEEGAPQQDPLPAWTTAPPAPRNPETVEKLAPGPPPGPDFLRETWEENPRKARWAAREAKRYLFFAFLSTELGNASTRLQQDLFASQAFHDLARDRMVLTYLDFPRSFGIQSDEIVRERYYQRFKDYFKVHGYPSGVLLDPEGNVVFRFRGYGKRDSVGSMVSEMRDAIGAGISEFEKNDSGPARTSE